MPKERKIRDVGSGEISTVRVEPSEHGYVVTPEGDAERVDVIPADPAPWSVLTEDGSFEARVRKDEDEVEVEILGERFRFGAGVAAAGGARKATRRAEVKAPMPGKVVKILASVGQSVSAGDGVLLFEAMKMQNEIRSPSDGVVSELAVQEGQAVDAREPLFVVQPPK